MPPLRVVFDTNVFIAAALTPKGAASGWVFPAKQDRAFDLYTSAAILDEVAEKLEQKFNWAQSDIAEFVARIRGAAEVVRPINRIDAIAADPDDNKILEGAVEARAHLIVSADPHLYKLKEYQGIQIIHPSSFKYIFPDQSAAA